MAHEPETQQAGSRRPGTLSPSTVAKVSEPRHHAIVEAIIYLGEQVGALSNTITGAVQCEEMDILPPQPPFDMGDITLGTFLRHAPQCLNNITDYLRTLEGYLREGLL